MTQLYNSTKTFKTCVGRIQPNGYCDSCGEKQQTSSAICGRLIETTMTDLSKEELRKTGCCGEKCDHPKCEWGECVFKEELKKELGLNEFDYQLTKRMDELPYTNGLDDGQYNDGVLNGFEMGANWAKDLLTSQRSELLKELKDQIIAEIHNDIERDPTVNLIYNSALRKVLSLLEQPKQ